MKKTAAIVPLELETERLLLRQWRPEDAQALMEVYACPEVEEQLGPYDLADTRAQIERFARQWRQEGFSHWAAEDAATGRLIGRIGLLRHHDWPESDDPVEVGWTLHPDHWGRGLATEGGRAAMQCWVERLLDPQLISITRPANARSRAVMERLGLTFRGSTSWRGHEHVWYATDRQRLRHR